MFTEVAEEALANLSFLLSDLSSGLGGEGEVFPLEIVPPRALSGFLSLSSSRASFPL